MSRLDNLGKDFAELFDVRRGDLIYGLRMQRDSYREHYEEFHKLSAKKLDPNEWWTADQYNNTFGIQVLFDRTTLDSSVQDDRTDQMIKPRGDRVIFSNYLQKMLMTPRRNPYETLDRYNYDGDAMILYEGTVYPEDAPENTKKLKALSDRSIRRACKFGLEYVAGIHAEHGSRIHFILDGLSMKEVIAKTKVTLRDRDTQEITRVFVPITYSELRNVFRKWHTSQFSETIYFYREFIHVPAPWEEKPNAWKEYAMSRIGKYRKSIDEMLAQNTYYPYRIEIQELLAGANYAEKFDDPNKAADALKTATEMLNKLRTGAIQPTPLVNVKNLSGSSIAVHINRALKKYNKKLFTNKSGASKQAYQILELLLNRGNEQHILNALHWYLEILPRNISSGTVMLGGAPISRTGRLHRLLEAEYVHYRFNIVNGMFDI